MTNLEIVAALKAGESMFESQHMIFKYGKLTRGTKYSYKVGDKPITKTQFEKIKDTVDLKRIGDSLGEKEYKLKV